jgi:hypothetical protein
MNHQSASAASQNALDHTVVEFATPSTSDTPRSKPGIVSVITSEAPAVLGKQYRFGMKGLEVETSAHLSKGKVERREFANVNELMTLLSEVSCSQALCSSVPVGGAAISNLVTQANLEKNPGSIARTKDFFEYPVAQHGLIVFDYDCKDEGKAREELVECLTEVCPMITQAGVVWWCSSSSYIYDGDTPVNGLRGQRLYVMLSDISDTVRAGGVILDRLWLAGHGHIEVSNSGAFLTRSLFDKAMFEPARLDFIGGAICEPPLSQRRGQPVSVCGEGWLDSRKDLPDLTSSEKEQLEKLRSAARDLKRGESDAKRQAWKLARMDGLVEKIVATGTDREIAKERSEQTLSRALNGALSGDFEIPLPNTTFVSVNAVLANPERWDGQITLDPLEPEYNNGHAVGKLFISNNSACLYSFAHGGTTYQLLRQSAVVIKPAGRPSLFAELICNELCLESDLFQKAGQLVMVDRDGFKTLDRYALKFEIGKRIDIYGHDKNGGKVPTEVSLEIADMVLSSISTFKFRQVDAVLTLPCAAPGGELLVQPGYDPERRLFLKNGSRNHFQKNVSVSCEMLITALKTLWEPWSKFEFATPHDRGAMLAAILTAISRPTLGTAPGFLFDAPTQASGKTLAARAVNALITGKPGAGMVPFRKDLQSDVELYKTLMSLSLRDGCVFQLDNLVGHFKSPTLAAHLTSGEISGRLLGGNQMYEGPARFFVTVTSNNGSLDRDLSRRFVRIRIDTKVPTPQSRKFSFLPETVAIEKRFAIADAALTLMKAFIDRGMPQYMTDHAGFAQWSQLIRGAVLWIQHEGLDQDSGIGPIDDPAHALITPPDTEDPELAARSMLLAALHRVYGTNEFKANEIASICAKHPDELDETQNLIRMAMVELVSTGKEITALKVAGQFHAMRDQIMDGLHLTKARLDRNKVQIYRIETTSSTT